MERLIALTGFMGSGKSAVGRALAEDLGWDFLDLDDRLEQTAGAPITSIFAERGEAGFRELELAELETLLPATSHTVLALGGGTLTIAGARDLLRRHAVVVYLDVDADTCWGRTQDSDSRPLARERTSFEALEEARRPAYLTAADLVVDGCGHVGEICQRVKAALPPEILHTPREHQQGHDAPQTAEGIWHLQLRATARPSLIVGGPGSRRELGCRAEQAAAEGKRARIISDEHVWGHWGEEVSRLLSPLVQGSPALTMVPGEGSKSLDSASAIWQWLSEQGMRRQDLVVAVGGGVVGDLAGFVAACYMRGTGFWQVPTSLLAQVDSSVGGKVAVNLPAGKNLVGAFYQPELVVIDPDLLATLSPPELVNGFGEVVKYALLSGETLLEKLEASAAGLLALDASLIDSVVQECVRYKARVVEEDERESGRRAVLNLGHTFAHALEAAEGFGGLPHGRAVALGVLVALRVSELVFGLDAGLRERVSRLLGSLELPVRHELPSMGLLRSAAGRDKKVSAEGSNFVALRAAGDPVCGVDVPWDLLEQAIEVVRA